MLSYMLSMLQIMSYNIKFKQQLVFLQMWYNNQNRLFQVCQYQIQHLLIMSNITKRTGLSISFHHSSHCSLWQQNKFLFSLQFLTRLSFPDSVPQSQWLGRQVGRCRGPDARPATATGQPATVGRSTPPSGPH